MISVSHSIITKTTCRHIDTMNSIGSGVAKGIYQVAEDTVAGVYHLVTHPIDSVISIADALYNYDRTYSIIVDKIKSDIDKFHTLSTEEKAKFITQASLELATLVTPRGFLKSTRLLWLIAIRWKTSTDEIIYSDSNGVIYTSHKKEFVNQRVKG